MHLFSTTEANTLDDFYRFWLIFLQMNTHCCSFERTWRILLSPPRPATIQIQVRLKLKFKPDNMENGCRKTSHFLPDRWRWRWLLPQRLNSHLCLRYWNERTVKAEIKVRGNYEFHRPFGVLIARSFAAPLGMTENQNKDGTEKWNFCCLTYENKECW